MENGPGVARVEEESERLDRKGPSSESFLGDEMALYDGGHLPDFSKLTK